MTQTSTQNAPKILKGSAAEGLQQRQDEILLAWEQRIRKDVKMAGSLSQPMLIDTIPLFLVNLAQALAENHPRNLATESNSVAEEHGGERARVTRYGPEQIIQEYQILRAVIEEKLSENVELSPRERTIIQKSFDQAIQEAMTAYFLVHGRVRDQFVATLSHDLRNPLAAAKVSAEVMVRELSRPVSDQTRQEIRELGLRVADNIRRADRMIQNLLDTNFMQLGERLILNLEKCDSLGICESIVRDLAPQERSRVKLTGDRVLSFWDCDGICRALENLISNAFKYGLEDSPVTINVVGKLGRVIISVHNQGNPIPAEDQELLFQPFRRSESAKTSGKVGWGIGLALARGVAESHGGSIGVDSSQELGTTFNIDIPADARPFQIPFKN